MIPACGQGERRFVDAAAGIPQLGVERVSSDAWRRHCGFGASRLPGRQVAISFIDTDWHQTRASQRIFDLFLTTKEHGSGIGLSMVYRTIQMHDGEIEVQSTAGAGTTFRILLPEA